MARKRKSVKRKNPSCWVSGRFVPACAGKGVRGPKNQCPRGTYKSTKGGCRKSKKRK